MQHFVRRQRSCRTPRPFARPLPLAAARLQQHLVPQRREAFLQVLRQRFCTTRPLLRTVLLTGAVPPQRRAHAVRPQLGGDSLERVGEAAQVGVHHLAGGFKDGDDVGREAREVACEEGEHVAVRLYAACAAFVCVGFLRAAWFEHMPPRLVLWQV